MNDKTREIIETVRKSINKQYKDNVLFLGLDDMERTSIDVIPTGSLGLDTAMGVGGWPKGRIVEIYGEESSGKSTLVLTAIAQCQKMGGIAALIDTEHSMEWGYAEALGVNTNDLMISQPDYGEQALDVADTLLKTSAVDLIALDSVAGLVPKAELEGDMGKAHVGLQARLMGQAMRKMAGVAHDVNTLLMFTNQTRFKVGITYGSPITTPGGQALKFYASVRVQVARIGMDKENGSGSVKVKVVKNKVAVPFKEAEFDLIWGKGIDSTGEIIDLAEKHGLVNLKGPWYIYKDYKIQGKDRFREMLLNNPQELGELTENTCKAISSMMIPTVQKAQESNEAE